MKQRKWSFVTRTARVLSQNSSALVSSAYLVLLAVWSVPILHAQQTNASPANLEWPRVFVVNGTTNMIFQPQLESWNGFTLKGRSAVSIQPSGSRQPTFGTINISAEAEVDKAERIVYFDNFQITEATFPSEPQNAARYLQTFRGFLPKEVKTMSLDRVEASLAILEQKKQGEAQALLNNPPAIIFSTKPALLISMDGEPRYRPVEGTTLDRIVNTHALFLREKSGKHYLHIFDGYVTATNLNGPWQITKNVPANVKFAEKKAVESKQVDLLAGQENPETKQKPSLNTTPAPEIYIAAMPAELIVTSGEPKWTPIPSTHLLYATNTASHVFKDTEDQKTYVLISGRWFSADSTAGPWHYVPSNNLPGDFSKIPDDSPQENTKAAIAGTRQAQEAAIANDIPQTSKISRREAKMDPVPNYEGGPQLKQIDGINLQYVANSEIPVIRVEENQWYACQDGVWFTATSSDGPWTIADSVPSIIYSIPPSCPIYYVTYVRVYNADSEYVWVAVKPGYYGTAVDTSGVVVYGTGYEYPPYIDDTMYVSYPITYGYATNPTWTPWGGWAFGFAAGWALADDWNYWAYCPPAPYWGPYRSACYGRYYNPYGGVTAWGPYGWAGTSGNIYHQAGPRVGVSRGSAGFNAWTGNQWANRYGRAYNSVTGTRIAGSRSAVNNVYTGNWAYGGRGVAVNEASGAAAAGSRVTAGGPGRDDVTAARGVIKNPRTGQTTTYRGVRGEEGGIARVNGQVVAARDGNVYRGNNNGNWDPVTPTPYTRAAATPAQPQQTRSFNNEAAARYQGAQRQASFQATAPSFGGGARMGGGGGRRR